MMPVRAQPRQRRQNVRFRFRWRRAYHGRTRDAADPGLGVQRYHQCRPLSAGSCGLESRAYDVVGFRAVGEARTAVRTRHIHGYDVFVILFGSRDDDVASRDAGNVQRVRDGLRDLAVNAWITQIPREAVQRSVEGEILHACSRFTCWW